MRHCPRRCDRFPPLLARFRSERRATRIDPDTIRKRGKVPKNASIFFTIFQTFMTGDGQPSYEGYAPDFFDFIIIDECHRGGANDEGNWRGILEYFAPAVQLGLTATPKRKHNADTYAYFGDPVFVYSLREGIEDGFLTPFKVRQMASTLDEYVWDGTDEIVAGEIEKDRYTEADFNTKIVIDERERSRVAEFMAQIDQRQKTLVFCATQDHALRVRDHINQIKTSTKPMSAQEFLDRLFGDLVALVVDEDDLRRQWSDPERREHFIAVLEQRGYDADKMAEMRRLIDAPNSDMFDVLAYIRFTVPPKTRSERADAARSEGLAADAKMQEFLLGILQAYEEHGEGELAVGKLSNFLVSRYGSVADAKAVLGDVRTIRGAFVKVQRNLYRQ